METFTKCQKRGTEANSFAAAHTDVLTGQQPFLTEDAILQQPKLDCWRFPVLLSACVMQPGMAIYNLEKHHLPFVQCLSQTDRLNTLMKRFLIFILIFICNWVHMSITIFVHSSSSYSWFWHQKELKLFSFPSKATWQVSTRFKNYQKCKNVELYYIQKVGSSHSSVKTGWNNLIQKLADSQFESHSHILLHPSLKEDDEGRI